MRVVLQTRANRHAIFAIEDRTSIDHYTSSLSNETNTGDVCLYVCSELQTHCDAKSYVRLPSYTRRDLRIAHHCSASRRWITYRTVTYSGAYNGERERSCASKAMFSLGSRNSSATLNTPGCSFPIPGLDRLSTRDSKVLRTERSMTYDGRISREASSKARRTMRYKRG